MSLLILWRNLDFFDFRIVQHWNAGAMIVIYTYFTVMKEYKVIQQNTISKGFVRFSSYFSSCGRKTIKLVYYICTTIRLHRLRHGFVSNSSQVRLTATSVRFCALTVDVIVLNLKKTWVDKFKFFTRISDQELEVELTGICFWHLLLVLRDLTFDYFSQVLIDFRL